MPSGYKWGLIFKLGGISEIDFQLREGVFGDHGLHRARRIRLRRRAETHPRPSTMRATTAAGPRTGAPGEGSSSLGWRTPTPTARWRRFRRRPAPTVPRRRPKLSTIRPTTGYRPQPHRRPLWRRDRTRSEEHTA